jgi:two-component system, chemotaxis family, protein-glutamate methylesterase/glutaminase
MPLNAIQGDEPQAVAPVDRLAVLIDQATRDGSEAPAPRGNGGARPLRGRTIREMERLFGPPTSLTCPECGGALWQGAGGKTACHVGHRFSAEELSVLQDLQVDEALWTAVRALEERAEIARRLGEQAMANGHTLSGKRFAERVRRARSQAADVRRVAEARTLAGHPEH